MLHWHFLVSTVGPTCSLHKCILQSFLHWSIIDDFSLYCLVRHQKHNLSSWVSRNISVTCMYSINNYWRTASLTTSGIRNSLWIYCVVEKLASKEPSSAPRVDKLRFLFASWPGPSWCSAVQPHLHLQFVIVSVDWTAGWVSTLYEQLQMVCLCSMLTMCVGEQGWIPLQLGISFKAESLRAVSTVELSS